MAAYVIAYDLRKPDHDYDPLYEAFEELGAKRLQESVWGLTSSKSTTYIFDYLWVHLHSEKDRLFVLPFNPKGSIKSKNCLKKLGSF